VRHQSSTKPDRFVALHFLRRFGLRGRDANAAGYYFGFSSALLCKKEVAKTKLFS